MTPEFSPISPDYAGPYKELLSAGGCRASDYSFGNIWSWAEHYGLEWRLLDGMCWIRQSRPQPRLWAPVGPWREHDWRASPGMEAGAKFIRVPEELTKLWRTACEERILLEESRGQWDYLYNAGELARLEGNRFHKKKNLLNQFTKSYAYGYFPLNMTNINAALEMQQEWLLRREAGADAVLLAESRAITRLFSVWERVPELEGGLLRVDDKVVAYTIGERISRDTLVVHFEKGLPGYKGVYQAINCFFAREAARHEELIYLNREQDLDDPGLRQSKESYNPVEYVKKSSVTLLP